MQGWCGMASYPLFHTCRPSHRPCSRWHHQQPCARRGPRRLAARGRNQPQQRPNRNKARRARRGGHIPASFSQVACPSSARQPGGTVSNPQGATAHTTSADCGARRGDWLGSGGRCHPGQRSTEQTTPGWQAAPAAAAGPTVSGACDGRPGSTSPEARSTEPPQFPLGRPTRRPSSPFPTLPPLGWERGQPTGKGQTPSRRTVLEATHRGGRRRSATQLGSSPRGGPITGRPRGGGALLCPHGLSRGKGPAGDVGAPSYNADLGPCGDRAKATRSTAAAAEGAVPGQRSGHVGHGGLSRRGHSACLLTTAHCHRDGSSIGSTPTIEERLFKRLYAEARSHLTLALADSGTDAWRCCRH